MSELPEVCTFRGIRKKVLREVWKRAKEAEAAGIPLTHEAFGKMLKEEWQKAIEESVKVCKRK